MATVTAATLEHKKFCLPRPDEDAPRIETYPLPRYKQDGITLDHKVTVVRCTECGVATYDGVPEDDVA